MPAEPAQRERRRAAQVRRHVEAAAHGQVAAQPGAANRADREGRPGRHGERLPPGNEAFRAIKAVERRGGDRAGQAHERVVGELQARAGGGALQRRRALGVADGEVGLAQRHLVHRAARRHADLPVPEAPRPVLHGRQRARLQHLDPRLGIGAPVQRRGRVRGGPQVRERERRAQQPQVGDDAVDPDVFQCRAEAVQRLLAVAGDRDDLREQRVVARGDLHARFNPGVYPDARGRPAPVARCGQLTAVTRPGLGRPPWLGSSA